MIAFNRQVNTQKTGDLNTMPVEVEVLKDTTFGRHYKKGDRFQVSKSEARRLINSQEGVFRIVVD